MKRPHLFLSTAVLSLILSAASNAQFPEKWTGSWKGMMHIYKAGKIVDSVAVSHIIKPAVQAGSFVWRTEYTSAKAPMVKDYVLRTKDSEKGIYLIDEGKGVELISYLMGAQTSEHI